MPSDILNNFQELEKLLQGIQKLTKKLKNFHRRQNSGRLNKVLQKFIVIESKAQSLISELSKEKISYSELERLRIQADEYERRFEDFEESMDEDQFERYKELRKSNFFEEKAGELTSTVSSSSFTNTDLRSSLRTLSINQSIKFDPYISTCCKCAII